MLIIEYVSDNRGRVVIITGIPYAPYFEPWVVLKKKYLDEQVQTGRTKATTTSATTTAGSSMTMAMSNATKSHQHHHPQLLNQPCLLTGQQWYEQSAIRAVNQAIGRVIRHKYDWGAIFLLDEKFANPSNINQLSKWLVPNVETFTEHKSSLIKFRHFITNTLSDPVLNPSSLTSSSSSSSSSSSAISHSNNQRRIVPQFDTSSSASSLTAVKTIAISNAVLLNSSQYDSNESENCFIRPELLLSQSQCRHFPAVGSSSYNNQEQSMLYNQDSALNNHSLHGIVSLLRPSTSTSTHSNNTIINKTNSNSSTTSSMMNLLLKNKATHTSLQPALQKPVVQMNTYTTNTPSNTMNTNNRKVPGNAQVQVTKRDLKSFLVVQPSSSLNHINNNNNNNNNNNISINKNNNINNVSQSESQTKTITSDESVTTTTATNSTANRTNTLKTMKSSSTITSTTNTGTDIFSSDWLSSLAQSQSQQSRQQAQKHTSTSMDVQGIIHKILGT